MTTTAIDQHIELSPGIRGGKPRIAGTRITVSDVVEWHLHGGQSLEEIAGTYDLPLAGLHAAMVYYYDHRAEIDLRRLDEDRYAEELRATISSPLEEKLRAMRGS